MSVDGGGAHVLKGRYARKGGEERGVPELEAETRRERVC